MRLVRIEYSSPETTKISHASSIEGALRAATIRLAKGEYTSAFITDMRFGGPAEVNAVQMLVIDGVMETYIDKSVVWIDPLRKLQQRAPARKGRMQ